MKKEVKEKNKKKIIINILVVIVFVLVAFFTVFYIRKKQIDKMHNMIFKSIKDSYAKNVVTTKKAFLYEKKEDKYVHVGYVKKDEVLSLYDKKIKDYNDIYFKAKNINYYVKYTDVKKTDKTLEKENTIYLNYGIKITTKDNFKLYRDDKIIYDLNKKASFDVIYSDEQYYKVKFNNKIYNVKKADILKEEDYEVKDVLEKLSIIYYENIYNEQSVKCSGTSCVKLSFFKENMDYLKEKNYISLSYEDYTFWKEGKIKLPKESILIIVNNKTDNETSLTNYTLNDVNESLSFNDNNKASQITDEKISRYKIISKTTKENFIDIVSGKDIVYKSEDAGQGIAVLNYHFFYDPESGEACGENICEPISEFKKHLDYLKSEGFKTLTIEEFESFMYGKISLPKKSVLITVDDGAFGTDTHLPRILDEYQMYATLFLITAWWPKDKYNSNYLQIQSHGYDIHKNGNCGTAMAICMSKEQLVLDLKKSIDLVDSSVSIAYPFYKYDDKVIDAVKQAGFKLAFAGGFKKAYQTSNKYAIPRYEIFNTTTLNQIKSYVN